MFIDFLFKVFSEHGNRDAIIWKGESYSYDWLHGCIRDWRHTIDFYRIKQGTTVALEGDFSPNSIALLLALIEKSCIIIPLDNATQKNKLKLLKIAQAEFVFSVHVNDEVTIKKLPVSARNDLYTTLKQRLHPGLVLFTSGTSGEPKAAVHDFLALLEKFKTKRKSLRTLNFLLFDHWGGLNTMFYILSNGGTIVAVKDRSPGAICSLIEKHHIELLPTSPTFLNLLLISEAYKKHDLSSLKIISYGTEPMLESTLMRMNKLFPAVKLQQTYGSIEVGVLRSKSQGDDSLWVKIGGEGFQTRVVDGILQIKAESAMLGYLNAPSPFTDDGWFNTGDAVECRGSYMRILGRKSEVINVGGEKVCPAEVESVIQEMGNVSEVTVYGERSPIVGNIVCAKVSLLQHEDCKEFISRLKKNCREKLTRYKVPVKVFIVNEKQHGNRYKKIRRDAS